jgi:diguanylate cyclase (GGDEF)-like protein
MPEPFTLTEATGRLGPIAGDGAPEVLPPCPSVPPAEGIALPQAIAAMHRILAQAQTPAAINGALQQLGLAIAADRVYLFRNHPHPVTEAPLASLRAEWCRRGTRSQLQNLELQNLDYHSTMAQWYERLASGEGLVNGLALGGLVQLGGRRPLRSRLISPILLEDGLWGFLGFDWYGEGGVCTPHSQDLLAIAASALGLAMTCQRTAARLESLQQRFEGELQQRTVKLQAAIAQLQREMADRRQAQSELRHSALHDRLTGLPNRTYWMELMGDMIALANGALPQSPTPGPSPGPSIARPAPQTAAPKSAQESDPVQSFAVLFVDIDRFQVVNDSLGHDLGDELLVAVAHRLRRCLGESDVLARLGGDEFAILLPQARDRQGAERVVQAIDHCLREPIALAGQEIYTSVSIGIALGPGDYCQEPERLLRDADLSMRQARKLGRSHHTISDRAEHDQLLAAMRLETDLRKAVSTLNAWNFGRADYVSQPEDSQFYLCYQPIVDITQHRICAFEALIRWQHPVLGLISPGRFIPIAEETDAIASLGLWTLYRACQQLRQWQDQLHAIHPNLPPLQMSVNLSCRQFARLDLLDSIERVIETTAIDPSALKLEITESTIVGNADLAKSTLQTLQNMGIQLCLDDFGTGYSSLSYLHQLPLDTIKIDRAFIEALDRGPKNQDIVKAILTLADTLRLSVIAEGVETPEQLQTLRQMGCTYIQGYLFSKPVRAEAALQLLRSEYPMRSDLRAIAPPAP